MVIRATLVFAVLVMLLGLPAGVAARESTDSAYPVASAARIGGDDKETRLVVDLSRKIDVHAFALADPYRVVLDIPQTSFQLPAKSGETGRGLIKAYRYGLVMQGGSRIVIDVTQPVRIEKAFVLDGTDGQPARLVLDLAATDRTSFMHTLSLENRTARTTATRRLPPPRVDNDPRPIIVVDPGHGGIDNGTQSRSGVQEKDIVLEFGRMLRDKLEKTGKYRVAMTRTDDTFVPLGERVKFARERKAALFISIHCDALRRSEGDVQGASVYTLSENASDAEAARLADAENRADVIAGVDLSDEPNDIADILIDLAQRETKTFSVQFARSLVDDLKGVARLHKRPLKSAGFRVLKAPDVPSVLIELGYVTNSRDLGHLTSRAWRERTGDAMVEAIDNFFATRLAGNGSIPRP